MVRRIEDDENIMEIQKILTDSIHYPDVAKAIESLAPLELRSMLEGIGEVLQYMYRMGYESRSSELLELEEE